MISLPGGNIDQDFRSVRFPHQDRPSRCCSPLRPYPHLATVSQIHARDEKGLKILRLLHVLKLSARVEPCISARNDFDRGNAGGGLIAIDSSDQAGENSRADGNARESQYRTGDLDPCAIRANIRMDCHGCEIRSENDERPEKCLEPRQAESIIVAGYECESLGASTMSPVRQRSEQPE